MSYISLKNRGLFKLLRVVIVLALLTQINHAAWVFNGISQSKDTTFGMLFSWIFAISLETSIFIFTMSGKKSTATFFAVVSTLINLLYYWYSVSWSFDFVAMVVVSPIIPLTIWYYSDLVNEINGSKKK